MMFLHASPIGRMLLPWLAGIVWANCYAHAKPLPFFLMAMGLIGLCFLFTRWPKPLKAFKLIAVRLALLLIPACLSVWHTLSQNEQGHPKHYSHQLNQPINALLEVVEPAIEKEKTIKLVLRIIAEYKDGKKQDCCGKIWVYIPKENIRVHDFIPGQQVWMRLTPKSIPPNALPGTFNYAQYAAHQQVYGTAFVPNTQWRWAKREGNTLDQWQMNCTQFLTKRLSEAIHHADALGIAEALLFGERHDIDPALWQHYARSGMVHLVAISGMHLGLVYLSLLSLFTHLLRRKQRGIIPALICLWIFAWITGMPASVLRAAWMFTLLGLAELSGRQQYSRNTLLASALIMLVVSPFQLFDIGFQLSYLAVGSLMVFQAPIAKKLYTPQFPQLKPITQLIAGTLAAQILTTPWLLYLFQQIPLWVLFTNIIAVPFSTFIIYAEIIWVALSPLPLTLTAFGSSLTWCILQLNGLAEWVSTRPYAVWETAVWTLPEIAMTYITAWLVFHAVKNRKPSHILYALVSLNVLLILAFIEHAKSLKQSGWVLYPFQHHLYAQVYKGNQTHFFNSGLPNKLKQYQVAPFCKAKHLRAATNWPVYNEHHTGFQVFRALNRTVVYLEKPYLCKTPIEVDVLLLREHIPLGPWLHSWHCQQVVQFNKQSNSLNTPYSYVKSIPYQAIQLFASP